MRHHTLRFGLALLTVISVAAVLLGRHMPLKAQGNQPLREPINEVLLEMSQDGTLSEIESRWSNE